MLPFLYISMLYVHARIYLTACQHFVDRCLPWSFVSSGTQTLLLVLNTLVYCLPCKLPLSCVATNYLSLLARNIVDQLILQVRFCVHLPVRFVPIAICNMRYYSTLCMHCVGCLQRVILSTLLRISSI
jgi:putative effector of murein hydrolase LrgA (UPF0299 family)